mmetsp:Transcript_14432/g.30934  ORF Transcript_14432/g.30934 Transcript_14432/m.30934 type:complete len:229 (-) Transcript_14432:461-1147(-)
MRVSVLVASILFVQDNHAIKSFSTARQLAVPPQSTVVRRRNFLVNAAVSSIGISLGTELPLTANADYGEGANLKLPGLVPSPIRPTGPIAEYCEVVALGREDICLEEKKQVSLYEKSGGSAARSGALLSKLSAQREALLSKVLPLVEQGKLVQAERELMSPLLQELTGTVNQLASSEQALKSHLPSIKSNVQTASVACKKRDGPTAKKAISELLSGLNAFSEAASSSR